MRVRRESVARRARVDAIRDGNHRRDHVKIVDKEPVAKGVKGGVVDPGVQPLRQPHVHRLDVGPPHQIAHPFQKIGQTDGRHEQDNRLLPHQMPEHEPLHRPGQRAITPITISALFDTAEMDAVDILKCLPTLSAVRSH